METYCKVLHVFDRFDTKGRFQNKHYTIIYILKLLLLSLNNTILISYYVYSFANMSGSILLTGALAHNKLHVPTDKPISLWERLFAR